MQVLFETVPAVIPARMPDGSTAKGVLHFQVQVYAPGEEGSVMGGGGRTPHTAQEWLEDINSQDKVVVHAPRHTPTAPPVEIPAAVLRAVPGDRLVVMEWTWSRVK